MNKYFPLIIITITEATIGIFVKLAGEIPIFTLNFYRIFFAFLFLLAVMPEKNKKFWKFPKKEIKSVVIIGFLIALQTSLFNIAMKLAPVANVVVLWSIYPFFVFILSSIFLNEKTRKIHIFIFLLALLGILVSQPLSAGNTLGNLISLSGGFVFACLISYMRYAGKTKSTGSVFWFMLIATIILFPSFLIFGPGEIFATETYNFLSLSVNIPVLLWILCLGVISTGLAYLFMTFALKKISAGIYSLVDIIVSPVIATILALIILKEIPSLNIIYGGAILLISAFLLSTSISKQRISKLELFRYYMAKIRKTFRKTSP